MNGYTTHYRNGFDGQGLWVEVEVEKDLGFKNKKDVENFGLENFTNACVDRVKKYSEIICDTIISYLNQKTLIYLNDYLLYYLFHHLLVQFFFFFFQ